MNKMRNKKHLILYLSLFLIFLFVVKTYLSSNENQVIVSENMKTMNYFKTSVNWSEFPIVENVNKNRILVLGEARSGTSFIADLLHQSWPTFYAFEPLFLMKGEGKDIRNDIKMSEKALNILARIYECDFEHLSNFPLCLWKNERNLVMQKYPKMNKTLVWDKTINQFVCQRCDNMLIKSIRISVKQFIELQRKIKKAIKLVFIVRDPRGVMSSRYLPLIYDWCRNETDIQCAQIDSLCKRMNDDLNELVTLNKNSPGMVSLVRYEDLSLGTIETAKSLLKKLGLDFNIAIEKWIQNHTTNNRQLGDPYSTARLSKDVVFSWIKRLNSTQVNSIQEKCFRVMDLLGYNLVNSSNYLKFENNSNIFNIESILKQKFKLDYLRPITASIESFKNVP